MSVSDICEEVWLSDSSALGGRSPSYCDLEHIHPQPMSPIPTDDNEPEEHGSTTSPQQTGRRISCTDNTTHDSGMWSDYSMATPSNDSRLQFSQLLKNTNSMLSGYNPSIMPINIYVTPSPNIQLAGSNSLPPAQHSCRYAQNTPYFGQITPQYSQHHQPHEQTTPFYGQSTSLYRQTTPHCEQTTPFCRQPTHSRDELLAVQIDSMFHYVRNQLKLTPFNHASLYEIETNFRAQHALLQSFRRNAGISGCSSIHSIETVRLSGIEDDYFLKCQYLIAYSYNQLAVLPKKRVSPESTATGSLPAKLEESETKMLNRSQTREFAPDPANASTPKRALAVAAIRCKSKITSLAVSVMNEWYTANEEHPYPAHDTCEVLSRAGGIQVDQVKKWFANRRMRARNTKNLREIAARRMGRKRKLRASSTQRIDNKKMKIT